VSDYFPSEIAFLLEHVEYGFEVHFQAYNTYSYEDVADLEYGEDFLIQHTFEGLPNGTYRLYIGDSSYDGICSGYYTCQDQENIILGNPLTNETIWTDNGNYFGSTEIYVYLAENGTVIWVSMYEEGTPLPTPAPTYIPSDEDFPGAFPNTTHEVIFNIVYDSFIYETDWYFQRLGAEVVTITPAPSAAPTVFINETEVVVTSKTHEGEQEEVVVLEDVNEWVTFMEGPDGYETSYFRYSYTISLNTSTLYRFQILDSYG
jgi:hypothetical protein